jgi:hypothetical protein
MTSSSSNHDFHLQTPLSTTTTTTTTPPFKTEERVFAARNLRNVLMMDGWMGGSPNHSLSLCLSSSSLARELQSDFYFYFYFFYYFTFFFCGIFLFSKQSAKNRKKQGVCHTVALPLKSNLKAKRRTMETQIFHLIFQKSSKRN